MTFLSDIAHNLDTAKKYADDKEWSEIISLLSWRSLLKLHQKVVTGLLRDEAAVQTAMLIQHRAYADLMRGMYLEVTSANLLEIAQCRNYPPAHRMAFFVHVAQCKWALNSTTHAYGYLWEAQEVALSYADSDRDEAIITLIKCAFSVREAIAEPHATLGREKGKLQKVAAQLWPRRNQPDSWHLRRMTFLWLAIIHQHLNHRIRKSWYMGRAGRFGQNVDWDKEIARPIPFIVPSFPYGSP